jgi:hypothetical protein
MDEIPTRTFSRTSSELAQGKSENLEAQLEMEKIVTLHRGETEACEGHVTVSCPLCDVTLEASRLWYHMLQHSMLTSGLEAVRGGQGIALNNDLDQSGERLRCRMDLLEKTEKHELKQIVSELESESSGPSHETSSGLVTCRFCVVELEGHLLNDHEARHLNAF